MTVTEIDHEPDVASVTRALPQPARWWAIGLAGLLVGVAGGYGLTQRPAPRPVAPVKTAVTLAVLGAGQVDYAGVFAPDGPGQVSQYEVLEVAAPFTAVLTVRAPANGTMTCRIYLDRSLTEQEVASDGHSATCVVVR